MKHAIYWIQKKTSALIQTLEFKMRSTIKEGDQIRAGP